MRKAQSATPANQPQISSKTVASTTCNFGVCSKHLPRLAQSSLAEDLSSSVVKSSDFVDGFGLCRVAAAFAWGQDLLRYMADQADEEYLQATTLLNFPVVRIVPMLPTLQGLLLCPIEPHALRMRILRLV